MKMCTHGYTHTCNETLVAKCPYFRGTVPCTFHFFKGCPSKDLRISIVVPTMDIGYDDRNNYMEMYIILHGMYITLYGNVPTFESTELAIKSLMAGLHYTWHKMT